MRIIQEFEVRSKLSYADMQFMTEIMTRIAKDETVVVTKEGMKIVPSHRLFEKLSPGE